MTPSLSFEDFDLSDDEIRQEELIARWRYPSIEGYEGIIALVKLIYDNPRNKDLGCGDTISRIEARGEDSENPAGLSEYDLYLLSITSTYTLEECSKITGETVAGLSRYMVLMRDEYTKYENKKFE